VLVSPPGGQTEPLAARWALEQARRQGLRQCGGGPDLPGQGLYYEYPSAELRDLRNLLSLNRKLKKIEPGLRLRIRNHLVAQYFSELD